MTCLQPPCFGKELAAPPGGTCAKQSLWPLIELGVDVMVGQSNVKAGGLERTKQWEER